MKKKVLISLIVILLIVAVGGVLLFNFHKNQMSDYTPNRILTAAQAKEDAGQLINIIESTHPEFSLNDVPAGYKEAKNTFIAEASKEMSSDDLNWLACAYLASLHDGHTSVYPDQSGGFLSGSYRMTESGLFETDNSGNITGEKVTAIGGIPMSKVYKTVAHYKTAENEAAVMMNDTMWSTSQSILERAGVNCKKLPILMTEQDGTKISSTNVILQKKNPYSVWQADDIIDSHMIGDIFYIGLHECETGTELNKTIDSLCQAINKGTTRVIIDVRNNAGGNSVACEKILTAMKMNIPQYGVYIRKSPLAVAQRNGKVDWNTNLNPDPSIAQTNPHIKLAVLTNEFTFSSATMLAVFTQDGKLGTVIGYPSANSPSNYGDVLTFQLKNSKIKGQVSFKRWLRPDTKADQRILHPDILVPIGKDTLKTAVRFLDQQPQ